MTSLKCQPFLLETKTFILLGARVTFIASTREYNSKVTNQGGKHTKPSRTIKKFTTKEEQFFL